MIFFDIEMNLTAVFKRECTKIHKQKFTNFCSKTTYLIKRNYNECNIKVTSQHQLQSNKSL